LLLLGFCAPNAFAFGWMALHGSASEYYRQAWQWGRIYAANTFVEHPFREGLTRTENWMGFHAALVVGAAIASVRMLTHGDTEARPSGSAQTRNDHGSFLAIWILVSLAGVILGLRFFPRYYFLLLPPMILAASRGWSLVANRKLAMAALCALLAVPLIRFGKPYITLARGGTLSDLAMDRDSRAASDKLRALARAGDTLFVWGFRPDIFIDSEIPAGTRFLESQPISGVLADRHLFSTEAIAPEFTAPNIRELQGTRPTWIVDGLGLYNASLALRRQAALVEWFSHYTEVARTDFSILYRLRP
jgi:hypothetical protein